MRNFSLRTRLLLSFLAVIIALGALSVLFGYNIIKSNVIKRAQNQVKNDLAAARTVYDEEIRLMGKSFDLITFTDDPSRIRTQLGLDYLYVVDNSKRDSVKSGIARRAFSGNGNGGTRVIDSSELQSMGETLQRRARIELHSTPKAHPTEKTVCANALAMEYAQPFFNKDGTVARVMYGGKIVNRYFGLIDRIHDQVYESKLYCAKPVGTVTIFMDDVRVATNVLDKDGVRAIGTRVSSQVYDNVVRDGKSWLDRAFVVTDWYLTAYEPIRDVDGRIAGIFYVGILEKPFTDMIHHVLEWYLVIIGIAGLFAGALAFFLAGNIAKPLTKIVTATDTVADGDLTHRVQAGTSIRELNRLADSFNLMAENIHKRDLTLREKNDQLAVLNARYLDLVGLVSHELKGILSSTMLNACTVRDGHLGEISPQQKKALDSVVRNLDYFDHTVKNFLNLSRIENKDMAISRTRVPLKEDIVDVSVDAYLPQAKQKDIRIENHIPESCHVHVDPSLILMVTNNLIGNAIKYGHPQGSVCIRHSEDEKRTTIEVFNTGRPLTGEETQKLFKRFSRLESTPEGKKTRGTGLGLFISRETVERHGGTMWCEPRENGNAFIFTLPKYESETFTTASEIKEYNYA